MNGICFEIQNAMGNVAQEKQYQDAFELKLKSRGNRYEREKELFFELAEGKVAGNRVDFVIDDKLPVDLKTKKYITKEDFRQMLRYLKAGKYRLGLIINFRGPKVVVQRVINSDLRSKEKQVSEHSQTIRKHSYIN